jgi:hypothetical protein
MNTGQMMMTVAAMVLLGVTVMVVNQNSLNTGTIMRQTEIGVYAVSLTTSYVQKAASLNFDEYTISNIITKGVTTNLTASLGVETSSATNSSATVKETANVDTTFDDFDDYNNFSKQDTVTGVDVFQTKASVYYVDTTSKVSASKTFYKRMDAKCWGAVGRSAFEGDSSATRGVDTIRLSYVFSYFK